MRSKHADSYLAHLTGLEIGGSAHNSFELNTRNVDYTDAITEYKQAEQSLCGKMMPVDIVAWAWDIPVPDKSVDFVISSHVIEHIMDPIKALEEWSRIARKYIYIICPQRDATPQDAVKPITTLKEIIQRHEDDTIQDRDLGHVSRWTSEGFMEMCRWFDFNVIDVLDPDDKVGNGFAVVIQVEP